MKRYFNIDTLFFVGMALLTAFFLYCIATSPPCDYLPASDGDPALDWFLNPANPLSPLSPASPFRL